MSNAQRSDAGDAGTAVRAVLLFVVLALGYCATLRVLSGTEVFESAAGGLGRPLFPYIQYLSWLPFGVAFFRWTAGGLKERVGLRSALWALVFAPGVTGIYGVRWLIPGWMAWGMALLYRSAWLTVHAVIYFVPAWLGAFAVMWTLSRVRARRRVQRMRTGAHVPEHAHGQSSSPATNHASASRSRNTR